MGLYRRGKVWWMSVTYRGMQIRRSTETADPRLARKIHAKVLTEITEGKWFDRLPGEHKTFREMMEKYVEEYSAFNKAPTSHRRDKSLTAHLNGFFGDLVLTEIGPKLIYEYKRLRRAEGAAPRTVCYELSLMSHAYNLAIKEWEWVRDNPVRMVSKDRTDNLIERWLTFEEEDALLEASPEWLREIISFTLNTGFRRSEVLGLRWPQVDLKRETLTILVQKNRSRDTVPLNEGALRVLKSRFRIRHIRTNLVFYTSKGSAIDASNLMRDFRRAVKDAGIEHLRFHDLRHTFITRLAQAGVDLYTIQKLGRWKNVSMVMRYAHHYPESLRPGVRVLDGLRRDSGKVLSQFYHSQAPGDEKGATKSP